MRMKRSITLILALLLLAGIPVRAFAEGEEPPVERIYLRSEKDLLEFAERCALESYSAGKEFILTANLNLSGVDFRPIPYFAGVFKGNAHSISGLNLRADGSRQGLFRTVGEGAEVRRLKVSGSVEPGGTQCEIGGLAGVNAGLISECSFEGSVNGIENVGGLVGVNEESGCITGSKTAAKVTGEHQVGGIAGLNRGVLDNCASSSRVNTVSITPVGEPRFDISSVSTEDFVNLTNIGGVAGENAGVVSSCTNNGPVGYKYTGYNVGGIAGKSSGFITGCTNSASVEGRRDVGGILGQLIPYAAWDFTNGKLEALGNEIEGMRYLVSVAAQDANAQTASLRNQLGQLNAYTSDALSALSAIMQTFIENDRSIIENIHINKETGEIDFPDINLHEVDTGALTDALNNMYAQSAALASSVGGSVSTVATNLNNITSQMTRIFDTLFSMVSEAQNAALVNIYDLSADEAYDHDEGAVASCLNRGSVRAETNAGGTVGVVAFEVAFDMEDKLDASSFLTGSAKQYLFAAVRACRNSAQVQSKSDNAGGIVGRMDIGAVVDCMASGLISSQSGGYVGGVAGTTKGSVVSCWSCSDLDGKQYLGGIAGLGNTIRKCRSWAHFERDAEYAGAIAGWAEGAVEENLYVEGRPAGVDDVSRIGQAEPMRQNDFLLQEGIPKDFSTMTVRFVKDGRIVDQVTVPFGHRLSRIPEIPNQDGQFWRWDSFDREHVYTDMTVGGGYFSPSSTLSSGEETPLFLVEGQFYENQALSVKPYTPASPPEGAFRAYTLQVNDCEDPLTVRMFAEGAGSVFTLSAEGGFVPLEAVRDGRYLVFTIPNGGTVLFVEEEAPLGLPVTVWVGAGAGLAAAAVLAAVLVRRKKKRAQSVE